MRYMKIAYSQFWTKNVDSFEEFAEHIELNVKKAAEEGAELILFPEFVTAELLTIKSEYPVLSARDMLLFMGKHFSKKLDEMWRGLSSKYSISIATGSSFEFNEEKQKYYNKGCIYGKNGELLVQCKVHPSYEMVYNKADTEKGEGFDIIEIDGIKYGIAICYDNSFPETARILASLGADVILAPSCCLDEWGRNRNELFARARATENMVYVVNAQLTGCIDFPPEVPYKFIFSGRSGTYAPINANVGISSGVVAQSEANKDEVVVAEIDIEKIHNFKSTLNNNKKDARPEIYKKYLYQ